jgi:copper chaperone NosL
MTKRARLLMAIAAILPAAAAFWPLWEVRLGAPQYPEGLGMRIFAYTVKGIKPNDLENINGLNHYIGMMPIQPDAIPELRYMPWILAALVVMGLFAAVLNSRRLVLAWLGAFATLSVVGLWDFWRWEYNYGHNLDMDSAIIVIPGMSYQPPLIGSKQLLNFTATAWPGGAAIALALAFVLAALVWWTSRQPRVAA